MTRKRIVIQMGHCFRQRGATGTHREQEFVSLLAPKIQALIEFKDAHDVEIILADQYGVAPCDLFLALHCDGADSPRAHGASVGYPADTERASEAFAEHWKFAHQLAGYRWGFRPDNYTDALRGYYYYDNIDAGAKLVIEHGFLTTKVEENWLFDNVDRVAAAHALAIDSYFGTLSQPSLEDGDDPTMLTFPLLLRLRKAGTGPGSVPPVPPAPEGPVRLYTGSKLVPATDSYLDFVEAGIPSVWCGPEFWEKVHQVHGQGNLA